MRINMGRIVSVALAVALIVSPAFAVDNAKVERVDAARVMVSWSDPSPVSVYVSDDPVGPVATAKLVSKDDRSGSLALPLDTLQRHYVLLQAKRGGKVTRVAERLLPLEQGSNFRDIGGYKGADGKTVRWGMIYRSGATPLLTDGDLGQVRALGLRTMIDLRSSEERSLAPSKIGGIEYQSIGYSMLTMMGDRKTLTNGGNLYRNFPTFLAPQLRLVFEDLLMNKGPIAYNCSAGQDRTGFATAMVLSALGVPRATILTDYHLSTAYRRPEFELPKIDPALAGTNPVAGMFAAVQKSPASSKPQPLRDPDGRAFLDSAFDEIASKYGSVDTYLEKEIGLTPVKRARLRALYLE
ncbi:MAG: tyrosine-protein phosphatase [Sphingomonadaceae bacterium]